MMVFNIPWGLVQPFISPYFFELTQGDYYLTGLLNGIPFITMVVSVFFFGWVVDKIGSKIVMILAFIFFIILLITLLLIADPYFFFLDYIVINGLLACFSPAVLKYASLVKTEINIFGALGQFPLVTLLDPILGEYCMIFMVWEFCTFLALVHVL
jgi:MFS family permease